MKFAVVVFPGSNCDHDCFYVIKEVLRQSVKYIWHKETALKDLDCVILPGGFSYGDYLRCGAVARSSPVMDEVIKFASSGGLVIGICNGFQVLLETGLLPGAMLKNSTLRFICKYVYLRTENIQTPFTNLCRKNQVLNMPIAHNEGNYYISDQGLADLEQNNQIAFRYSSPSGEVNQESNPNGAISNIAGVTNKAGNVLGMMPHPERSSERQLGSDDGCLIFKSIVEWVTTRKPANPQTRN